jgi:AI-2 transport protein TqsA
MNSPPPAEHAAENAADDSREVHLQTACLLVLTLLAVGVGLWVLRPVLVPFVLALFFTIGLSPLLDYVQQRLRSSRAAAIGVTFLLGVLLIVLFAGLLTQSISVITQNRAAYRESVGGVITWSANLLQNWGVTADALQSIKTLAAEHTQSSVFWLVGALRDLLVTLGVVLIFMFFLLAGASSEARPTTGLWAEIEGKIRGYIVTKTTISFFTGLAFGGVLWLFGVPLAPQLGVLAFLLNYVPNVGPVIASLLPIPIVMVMMPGLTEVDGVTTGYSVGWKIVALVAAAAVQIVSGNVIEPKVMGDSFELHPIVILLSLILWGMIWGPVGVLLAVPMSAAVKVLLERLEPTRPVAALMAGRIEPLESAIDRGGMA